MVYSHENFEEAKHLIGKKVICWTDNKKHESNVYEVILIKLDASSFHFVTDKETQTLKEKRIKNCPYEGKVSNCFEFIKPIDIDDDKNYLLDFD